MRSAATIRSLSLLLALATATCERTTPATEATKAPSDAPTRPKTDGVERPTPAADPTHPLELVPARARAMIMASSPQRLAQIWERDHFVGRFPAAYAELVEDMKRELGYDILDPAGLAAIGIDPTAPVGVAALSFQDEAFVAFGGLGSATALVELIQQRLGKPLEPEVVGEAKLYRLDSEVSLVLRHGLFAFVLVDRHPAGAPDYAQEVARIDPAQSLAHATSMERAHAGLPQEADIRALLDLGGIIRDELERSRRRDQESEAAISRQMAEARQRGASAEEIARLQQQAQSEQEFATRRRRERQVGELLLARTFGAIEGIGLAVDADAKRGLVGRIHLALEPEAIFRELFVTSDRPPTAIAAQGDAPQLVVSTAVEPGLAIELLAQIALADGSTYAELNDDVLRELRVDFDRSVRPLLDGRGTFVLTSGSTLDPKRTKDVGEAMGGLLALGVTDETKARALLDEVVAKHGEQRFVRAPEISGWTLDRTEHPRALHLGVVGGQLVVGTDLAVLRRLREGQAGSAASHYSDPEPWQRLTEGPGAGRLAMHHRLPFSLAMSFMGEFDSFESQRNPDDQLAGEFPDADVFSIPRSPATLKVEKQRDAASEARFKVQERRRNERRIAAWNAAEGLGTTAGVVREVDTGFVIEGGHYVEGGVFGYLETIMELTEAGKGSGDHEVARANKRKEDLEARLLAARRKDVERELAKRARAKAKAN